MECDRNVNVENKFSQNIKSISLLKSNRKLLTYPYWIKFSWLCTLFAFSIPFEITIEILCWNRVKFTNKIVTKTIKKSQWTFWNWTQVQLHKKIHFIDWCREMKLVKRSTEQAKEHRRRENIVNEWIILHIAIFKYKHQFASRLANASQVLVLDLPVYLYAYPLAWNESKMKTSSAKKQRKRAGEEERERKKEAEKGKIQNSCDMTHFSPSIKNLQNIWKCALALKKNLPICCGKKEIPI